LRILEIATKRDWPVHIDGHRILDYDWAPDASGLLVTSTALADLEQLHHKLFVVSRSGGTPNQYCATKGKVLGASFSPDGKSIAYLGNTDGASDPFPGALYVCHGPRSQPKNL